MPSPRSTLFPYTTLFRSMVTFVRAPDDVASRRSAVATGVAGPPFKEPTKWPILRSEARFSRNAEPEIYPLSLHDALPIYGDICTSTRRCGLPEVGRRDGCRRPSVQGAHEVAHPKIGSAVQQECRARDLPSFPTRRSSDLW